MIAPGLLLVSLVGYSSACINIGNLFPRPPPATTTTTTTTTAAPPVGGTCKCGQANTGSRNKIVGGVETQENEYPWQVMLTDQYSNFFCGGSIISSKEILTAAHCSEGRTASSIYVWVGEHDKTQADGEKYIQVCSKKEHESYSSSTVDYDFAILTLCNEIEFSQDVSPACLPQSAGQDPGLNEGVDTVISGWGRLSYGGNAATTLQMITMRTISNAVCRQQGLRLTDRMLCSAASGKSVCQGDSGGPWVTKVGRNYVLTGVSSWGPQINGVSCIPGKPSVAARVSNQLRWIKTNMRGATCPRA